MKHLMIAISGFSGAGKDECVSQLVRDYQAVQTGLADPGKRHMADAYGFTDQQLFGPSQYRNAGDIRIPKNRLREVGLSKWSKDAPVNGLCRSETFDPEATYWVFEGRDDTSTRPYIPSTLGRALIFIKEGDPEFWLSPREALQQYMEKMNTLDIYTWVRKGVMDQLAIASGDFIYNKMTGLVRSGMKWNYGLEKTITCFADFRHIQEIQYVRDFAKRSLVEFTPIVVRVKRPNIKTPPFDHRSETEQVKIRDAAFDAVILNDGTLEQLYAQMNEIVRRALNNEIKPKDWRDEFVISNRLPAEGYAS